MNMNSLYYLKLKTGGGIFFLPKHGNNLLNTRWNNVKEDLVSDRASHIFKHLQNSEHCCALCPFLTEDDRSF